MAVAAHRRKEEQKAPIIPGQAIHPLKDSWFSEGMVIPPMAAVVAVATTVAAVPGFGLHPWVVAVAALPSYQDMTYVRQLPIMFLRVPK